MASTQEDILQSIVDYVAANIDTYLDAITAVKNDGITLDSFREIAIDEADPFMRGKYPSCLVFPEDITDEQVSSGKDNLTMRIVFMITLTNGNSAALLKQSMRYAEAFRQLFKAAYTMGGAVDMIDPKTETRYAPSMAGQSDKKVAVITITASKEVGR